MTDIPDDILIQGLHRNSFYASGTLDAKGNVAWSMDGKSWFLLDPPDPRYQICLEKAHELQCQYPLDQLQPEIPADHKEIARREEAIIAPLVDLIHQQPQYGDYNPAIAAGADSGTHFTMHEDTVRQYTKDPAGLAEFGTNELVCRHYAPLVNALGSEAGMKVARMNAIYAKFFKVENDCVQPVYSSANNGSSLHTCVVSLLTGNVIEPTISKEDWTYQRKLNDVSVEDILAGKTVIVMANENWLTAYGPGNISGVTDGILAARREKIEHGSMDLLPFYDHRRAGESSYVQWAAEAEFQAGIDKECLKLVQEQYEKKIKPATRRFDYAAEIGDLETLRECCDEINFSKDRMAGGLSKSIWIQKWPAVEFLLDRGALKGYDDTIQPFMMPFWIRDPNIDEEFVGKFVKRLEIDPKLYLQEATARGREDHVRLALKLLSRQPESPDIKEAEKVVLLNDEVMNRIHSFLISMPPPAPMENPDLVQVPALPFAAPVRTPTKSD